MMVQEDSTKEATNGTDGATGIPETKKSKLAKGTNDAEHKKRLATLYMHVTVINTNTLAICTKESKTAVF